MFHDNKQTGLETPQQNIWASELHQSETTLTRSWTGTALLDCLTEYFTFLQQIYSLWMWQIRNKHFLHIFTSSEDKPSPTPGLLISWNSATTLIFNNKLSKGSIPVTLLLLPEIHIDCELNVKIWWHCLDSKLRSRDHPLLVLIQNEHLIRIGERNVGECCFPHLCVCEKQYSYQNFMTQSSFHEAEGKLRHLCASRWLQLDCCLLGVRGRLNCLWRGGGCVLCCLVTIWVLGVCTWKSETMCSWSFLVSWKFSPRSEGEPLKSDCFVSVAVCCLFLCSSLLDVP